MTSCNIDGLASASSRSLAGAEIPMRWKGKAARISPSSLVHRLSVARDDNLASIGWALWIFPHLDTRES